MPSPYGASTLLSGITWDFAGAVLHQAQGSDLWPAAWRLDGQLMMGYSDGGGFHGSNTVARTRFGMHTVTGTPPSSFVYANTWGCKADGTGCDAGATHDPLADAQFGGPIAAQGVCDGLTAVGNDLYALVTSREVGADFTQLVQSTDSGHTWTAASWTLTHNTGDFAPTTFVQYGAGQQDQPANTDGYLLAPGGIIGDVTKVYLARVPKSTIMTQSTWEFFTSSNPATPTWGTWANAQPIFTDPLAPGNSGPSGGGTMQYFPVLGRYLFIHLYGTIQDLHVFDSVNPWGPWTTVEYRNDWGSYGTSGQLFNTILNKFISADNTTFWMSFSGFNAPINWDSLNLIHGTLNFVGVPPTQNVLEWQRNSTDEDGFQIYRNPNATMQASYGQIATVGAGVLTYTDTAIVAGTQFCYEVNAFNAGGTSAFSNIACRTISAAPSAPTNLRLV